ncbi:MAG: hypothetical protein ABIQ91_00190 [Candidatus Paceibacterota bacterium]
MSFNFLNLEPPVRELMISEIEKDIENGKLYTSKRFTEEGKAAYPELLKEAARTGTEESLAESINKPEYFKDRELSTSKTGTTYSKDVSDIAYLTFAEGEFNKYYMRALCIRANTEHKSLEIYRAKEVDTSRAESASKIGDTIDPTAFLEDLRNLETNNFKYPASGWSGGANSGLSVKL